MPNPDSNRPLLGLAVGISAGQSEDSNDPGFHPDELNRSVIRIAQRLLAAGARVVLGHDWRKGGVMETLLKSPAMEHAASIGGPGQWAIVNLVPDRSEAPPPVADLEDYYDAGVLRAENAGMPAWWDEFSRSLPEEHREPARIAVSNLHMREQMQRYCHARVCIGGKTRDFSGFYPGILEEGWRTVQDGGKPLFVTALLGGAACLLAQQSGWNGRQKPADFAAKFRPAANRVQIWELLAAKLSAEQRKLLPDEDLLSAFADLPWAERAGLSQEEWTLLIEAPTADAVGVLTIRGLAKRNRGG